MVTFYTTASVLRAVLCFIDPETTPKIAYDDDSLSEPLIAKVKDLVGDKDGSQSVQCTWFESEQPLLEQFRGCCRSMGTVFSNIFS